MDKIQQQPAKAGGSPYLGRHVEHHGHDRRVVVAVDDEAHLSKPLAEIDCVLCQLSNAVTTWRWREEILKSRREMTANTLPLVDQTSA